MKLPEQCTNIDEIRSEIDRIDKEIITALAIRFEYVKEAAKFKKDIADVLAHDRHAVMFKQRFDLCNRLNIDHDLVENVYKILLDFYKQKQLEILEKDKKR